MFWQALFYLLPYLISLGISLSVGIFAYRRRAVLGARAFSIYALAEASMTLGFIIELISPGLVGKIFWDNFQFIGSLVAPIAFLAFVFRYTRRDRPWPRRIWWVLGILAGLFMILVYTDSLHGLIRPNYQLVPGEPFAVLEYGFTPTFWVYVFFIYGIALYCIGAFIYYWFQVEHSQRAQIGIILFGSLFPLLGAVLAVLDIDTGLPRDLTPFGFALGNLVVALGVFRYRLFNLVPVARKAIVEDMADAVMVLDADHCIVDLNAAAEQAIGLNASELLGQPLDVAFSRWPDLVARFRNVEEGRTEVTHIIGGEERTADLTISPLYDEGGHLVGRILVAHDVTDRKRAEEALRESEEYYRLLAENANDVIWVMDLSGAFTYVSPSVFNLRGFTPEEVMQQPMEEVVCPGSVERVQEGLSMAFEAIGADEESPPVYFEIEQPRKDGTTVWTEATAKLAYDADGRPLGLVGVSRDITARRAAEQALQKAHDELELRVEERTAELRASEERYRLLAENVDDVLWTRDANLERYTYVSPSITRLLGYTPEEMMARPAVDFIAPSSYELVERARQQRLAAEAAGTGGDAPRAWELEWQCKDGSTVWVESRTRVLRDEAGTFQGVIGVTRDISERKAVEEALRKSEAELKRAQEVSHTGSWRIDISTDEITWSDEAYRIFGIPIGTRVTYPIFLEYVHPDDRLVLDQAWNSALQREPYDVEHRILVDGEIKWVREQAEVEFDADGRAIYAVGTVHDVTALKEGVEKLHQYAERLQILYEISEGIISSRSPQAIAQVALDYIRQLVPCMGIAIVVIDYQSDKVEFLATDLGDRVDIADGLDSLVDQRMLYGDVLEHLRKGEIYIVDLEHSRSTLSRALHSAGAQANCHVPLVSQDELIGSLSIVVNDPTAFTNEHLEIAQRVADQLAIAVHQAQLYEQTQRYAQELEQMNRALALLNEAGRAFSSTLDQDQVFNIVLEEAHHLLDVAAIAIWILDPETEELVCRQTAGPASDLIRGWRLPLDGSVAGWVAQHGESQIIADAENDERNFKEGIERTGMVDRSIIAVPLQFKNDLIGVLQAVHTETDYFSTEDLALLEPLAASAVIAIDNARLFEEVHRAQEQLQALSRNLVDIQEAERAAVSRELHDEAGQSLSYLLLSLGMLEREAGDADAVIARSRTLEGMIEALLENLHRLSVRLRPASLDHLGLTPALEQYIETFINQYGIDTQFAAIGLGEKRFSPEVETALYRVVQEALTNVARHAQATHVDVLLEQRGDWIVVIVEDDGVGFDAESVKEQGRLGLVGMRERAHMLGGTWTIESLPGQGTTMVVEVPYADSDSDR